MEDRRCVLHTLWLYGLSTISIILSVCYLCSRCSGGAVVGQSFASSRFLCNISNKSINLVVNVSIMGRFYTISR